MKRDVQGNLTKYVGLLKNIGLFTISNVAIKLVTFILVPLYTAFLSTEEFGVTDMLNTVVSLVMPLVTLSIPDAVLRYCIEDKNNTRQYISVGFIVTFAGCVLTVSILPMLDLDFFGGLGQYKIWFIACFAAMSMQTFLSNVARGLGEVQTMAIASVFSSMANAITAGIAIAVLHYGVYGFFLSILIGNSVGCLYYLVRGHFANQLISCDRKGLAQAFRVMIVYAVPLIPNALFWWVSQSINRFFITGMLGIGATGLFAAAGKLPGMLNLISNIFQQAWNLSAFQQFREKGKERFFNVTYCIYKSGMCICAALLMICAPWIASFFLQKSFYRAWTYIPLLLLAFYFSALNAFIGSIYTSALQTRMLFTTTLVGAIVCVVATYFGVLIAGLQGACAATALANAVVWITRLHGSRKLISITCNYMTMILENLLLIALCVVRIIPNVDMAIPLLLIFVAIALVELFDTKQCLVYARS